MDTGIQVLVWAAIAGHLAWLGLIIQGESPKGIRKYLGWPFLGLGFVFMFLIASEIVLNMLIGPIPGITAFVTAFGMWVRSFF
jgi:hypothetical protein